MSARRSARVSFVASLALGAWLWPGPAVAQPAGAAASQPADPNPGALTLSGGIDILNQYMFRGIRQNSTGMAMWPWADLGVAVHSGDGGVKSVAVNLGTWNSLHTGDTGTDGPSTKLWYESDFYATLGLGFGGGLSLGATYTAYTSPNNTFSTVKEIMVKLAVDDTPTPRSRSTAAMVLKRSGRLAVDSLISVDVKETRDVDPGNDRPRSGGIRRHDRIRDLVQPSVGGAKIVRTVLSCLQDFLGDFLVPPQAEVATLEARRFARRVRSPHRLIATDGLGLTYYVQSKGNA